MATRDLTLAMVGSGGDGVITMGDLIAMAGAKEGLSVIKTEAYGPQIRGGESSCVVRISANDIQAISDTVDALVVFNWADFGRFRGEVVATDDSLILYEAADPVPLEEMKKGMPPGARWVGVPFTKMAKEATGGGPGKNIVTLGLLAEMFGLPLASIRRAVEKRFTKKGPTVIEANLKAFDAGGAYARTLPGAEDAPRLTYEPGPPKLLMSGNEATAVGAMHAGCRFFAGYPITPSSEVLHFLGEWLPKVGGTVIQTEDELSAYGAVIGGSFAGVKSMTATSGPGVSLMIEMIGLSSITEIPSVIVNVQRGGPSTGIPTKSEQGDLLQAIFGTHGDAPKVVLAATDVADSFHTTVDAFNIAEEYQIPVIVLSEQAISGRRETIALDGLEHEVIDRRTPTDEELENYQRYRDTPDGVSPMSFPGMPKGIYQTNGLEHDVHGRPSSMFLLHEKNNEKRYRKLWPIREKYRHVQRFGPDDAEVGILCWGGSKGPVVEAVARLNGKGMSVSAFVPRMLYPFPKHELEGYLARVRELLIVDINYSAQFYKYLRTFLTLPENHTHNFKRSGGKNLTVAEIEAEVGKILGHTAPRAEVFV